MDLKREITTGKEGLNPIALILGKAKSTSLDVIPTILDFPVYPILMSSDPGNNLSKSDEQIINEAEQNLNSRPMVQGDVRQGAGRPEQSSTARESGVDANATKHFEGASVRIGKAATGGGGGQIIPESEGGGKLPGKHGGRVTVADDFEEPGGPEDKARE